MSRSRFWVVAVVSAALMFALPLAVMNATADRNPELRLIPTGMTLSGLIVTDSSRTLLINSNDRGAARSAIGNLARPWEPRISTIIVPAEDRAAIGLWEALRLPSIKQVIVVGLPGSDPLWSTIERECSDREIQITYIGGPGEVTLDGLKLTLNPGQAGFGGHLSIAHGSVSVIFALTNEVPVADSHAVVTHRRPDVPVATELLILPASQIFREQPNVVYVREREVVTLTISVTELAVRGGRLQMDPTLAN